MLVTKMARTVTKILKLSPTHFISNIRHQSWCSHIIWVKINLDADKLNEAINILVNVPVNEPVDVPVNRPNNKPTESTVNEDETEPVPELEPEPERKPDEKPEAFASNPTDELKDSECTQRTDPCIVQSNSVRYKIAFTCIILTILVHF